MLWIRHRHLYFSPIFPYFSSFSTSTLVKILDKRPRTCATHGIHVAVHTPRSQVPPSLTWLMRHQPALITCLHSRPCFWTLGPRPLSIVPTISVPFRYRTILVNSPIGPRTHLASPLLSPHCSLLIPNRFSHCPVIVVLLFSLIPLFRFRTMAPVALLFCIVYILAL